PASASSSGSSFPAGSSHRYCFAACRYCRSITIHGSFLLLDLSIARITTLPLCRITSRSLFFPPGSISLSCNTRNSRPSYTTFELNSCSVSAPRDGSDFIFFVFVFLGGVCGSAFGPFAFLIFSDFLAIVGKFSFFTQKKYKRQPRLISSFAERHTSLDRPRPPPCGVPFKGGG